MLLIKCGQTNINPEETQRFFFFVFCFFWFWFLARSEAFFLLHFFHHTPHYSGMLPFLSTLLGMLSFFNYIISWAFDSSSRHEWRRA
jgi:hypothetical protein